MPPISPKTKFTAKLGVWFVALLAVAGTSWKVSESWTSFTTDFATFKKDTGVHFVAIEKTLTENQEILGNHTRTLNLVTTRQMDVLNDRWTETNMKDWSYQLERANRDNDAGKGLNVPDPVQFIQHKPGS